MIFLRLSRQRPAEVSARVGDRGQANRRGVQRVDHRPTDLRLCFPLDGRDGGGAAERYAGRGVAVSFVGLWREGRPQTVQVYARQPVATTAAAAIHSWPRSPHETIFLFFYHRLHFSLSNAYRFFSTPEIFFFFNSLCRMGRTLCFVFLYNPFVISAIRVFLKIS